VEFRTVDRFTTPIRLLLAGYADPGVVDAVGPLPPLSAGELLEHGRRGDTVTTCVRYAYLGDLPPGASRLVDPARLSWVQVTELDLAERRSRVSLRPDDYADRLDARATQRFEPAPGDRTVRTVEGELRVHVPVVGRAVERALVAGLTEWLSAEAAAVDRWASTGR
jgi:hypothetical protein